MKSEAKLHFSRAELALLAILIGTGAVPLLMRPLWESGGYAIITLALGVAGLGAAVVVGLFVSERRVSGSGSS